ncbi:MAG: hypothetical protein WC551_09320 [Patescibacteria group bacterium]
METTPEQRIAARNAVFDMLDLCHWKPLKKGMAAAKRYLAQFAGKTFTSCRVPNNRGDYGYDEIFSADGKNEFERESSDKETISQNGE